MMLGKSGLQRKGLNKLKQLVFFALTVSAITLQAQPLSAPFQPGERIAFIGDSITHDGRYIGYIQLFYALRHPGSNVVFIRGGINGEGAWGGLKRADYDIIEKRPDRVFVMFGMNDVGRDAYKIHDPDTKTLRERAANIASFQEAEGKLVDKILAAKKKLILMTPSPYDQYGKLASENLAACNDPGLKNCAAIVRKVAAEKQVSLVELYKPMTELLLRYPEKHLCGADRIHPGHSGHLLMAALILQALEESPVVAKIDIHAKEHRVSCERAEAKNARIAANAVAFLYVPAALPFPFAMGEYGDIDKLCGLTEKLNQETLRATGLEAGEYTLKADGRAIGHFSAEQLEKGINLAVMDTPSAHIAGAAMGPAMEQVEIEKQLRHLVAIEKIIRDVNGNPNDFKSSCSTLDDFLAKQQDPGYRQYLSACFEQYKKMKPQEAQLKQRSEECARQLDAVRPTPFTLELVKETGK